MRGPFSTPITPLPGSFFHADPHNENAITRLVGALLLEQNDEWAVQPGRYMTLESVAQLSDDPTVTLPAMGA